MPLNLMRIFVTTDHSLIEFQTLNSSIENAINGISTKAVNDLAKDALGAFKSKVPVYSKQLRNEHIQVDFAKKNQPNPTARVYIVDQPHTATRRGRIKSSANLARILNSGIHEFSGNRMRRSMNSIPAEGYLSSYSGISRGQPTEGWIDEAQLAFISRVGLVLNG